MIIDVTDPKTFPLELKNIISEYFDKLPKGVVSQIKSNIIQFDYDVDNIIRELIDILTLDLINREAISILKQYKLICYHSTKMLDKNIVLREGLRINEWDSYSKNMVGIFKSLGMNEDNLNQAMDYIKHQYDFQYSPLGIGAQLCFYSDLESIDKGNSASYEQFCENIGGEIARRALKKQHPELYKCLKENGEAFIVKFKMPFSDMVNYTKSEIVDKFVAYIAGRYFWNYNYVIRFEGKTQIGVSPNNILELIPYTKEIDY